MPMYDPGKIMEDAVAHNYAVAAFNIGNLESLQAVLWAAEKENAPIFVQVLDITEKYVRDVDTYLKAVRAFLDKCAVPVVLHHDHCSCVEQAIEAVDRGYKSVMFDGSALEFEENLEKTARVVEYAHRNGVWVEAELGSIPSFGDTSFSNSAVKTDAELAAKFIKLSGCDSLAVAVGTAHGGVAGSGYLEFDFQRLEALRKKCPDYPFVLHGAASMPHAILEYVNLQGGRVEEMHICSERDVALACKSGIHKANMDVDNWLVFTGAVRQYLRENPEVYYPLAFLEKGRDAWENEARHKIRNIAGSSGMAGHFGL